MSSSATRVQSICARWASAAVARSASIAGAVPSAVVAPAANFSTSPAARAATRAGAGTRPANVGILAMETYIAGRYIAQETLEAADGVSSGKYTVGLGQKKMAYVDDREDINSVCLSAVQRLLDRYGVDPKSIGRLEVGTESLVDKSKSTKTSLMRLLGGNADVEGATVINACYGGTAALFNSAAWVESSEWDGRYAVVVAGDIAVYHAGPARPTGGVGVVAMLVGRDAPLRLRPRSRATHAVDVYDFYKPGMLSEYPVVDGKLSQACYLAAVDDCYNRHMDKAAPRNASAESAFDHMLFHSPYHKLVQQSYRRIVFNDARRAARGGAPLPHHLAPLAPFIGLPDAATYTNKDLDKALTAVSDDAFARQVAPSTGFSQAIGNSYTGALWTNLACLVDGVGAQLAGRRLGMFSYGSGALATMFAVDAAPRGEDAVAPFSLAGMQHAMELQSRLASRRATGNEEFTHALKLREAAYGKASYTPVGSVDNVPKGAWYLSGIDKHHVRTYERKN